MDKMRIAIIGLGYVGLPLARLFATKYSVVGFDVKQERVSVLSLGEDTTKEVSEESLKSVLSDHLPEEGETDFILLLIRKIWLPVIII